MARVNIIVFTITVLWICNSVTESVQQDSNNNVKKHDGHIDAGLSEDLAAHDNGFSHGDVAATANIIDSGRRWRQGQDRLRPKKLSLIKWFVRAVAPHVLPEVFGRNLEPMTMNANDYDTKKFSKYHGTPLKRGYGRWKGSKWWDILDSFLPDRDSAETLSAMKETLKKKHSVGSIPNTFYDRFRNGNEIYLLNI